ncbi:Wound-induced protein 1 [Zostera marina]|uniref:Wound-induced protein 1 n=1 Tax=Zostera marina TaxID=29655 RepID=A0A0K9PSB2_ZOSMR|nr:Wound-induced protein 1 [Zostera marina]
MMHMLTGRSDRIEFTFRPSSIAVFGNIVIVEGIGTTETVSWVHAWTVTVDGMITQVREYFNTSLVVTRLDTVTSSASRCFMPIWQSRLAGGDAKKSVPELVLTI